MKITVKSACFIKGQLIEPGKNGAAVTVSTAVGAAAIACGRAVAAPKKPTKKVAAEKDAK